MVEGVKKWVSDVWCFKRDIVVELRIEDFGFVEVDCLKCKLVEVFDIFCECEKMFKFNKFNNVDFECR